MRDNIIRILEDNAKDGVSDGEIPTIGIGSFIGGRTVNDVKDIVTTPNNGQDWSGSWLAERRYTYLSALEAYICLKDAKNEHVIQYLKGEVDTLKL